MPYNAGVQNIRETPVAGSGTTAQRLIEVNGALWINLDDPDAPYLERYRASDDTWVRMDASAPTLPAWALSGNTLAGGEKLGSINAQPVVMYANNVEALRLDNAATYKLSVTGNTKVRGQFRADDASGNYVQAIPGNPGYIQVFDSGIQTWYLVRIGTNVVLSTNVTGTTPYNLLVNQLTTGGQITNNNLAGNCIIDAVAGSSAGNVTYWRMANGGTEKWIIGCRQGSNRLEFRFGGNDMSTGTLRVELLSTGGILLNGTTSILTGAGTPEGAVTAGVGSIFMRTDGGAGTTFYVKESGAGNTGWVAK